MKARAKKSIDNVHALGIENPALNPCAERREP